MHGGVGGVGDVAVQLAKSSGARVATTVSTADAATLARSLGADEAINFRCEETVPAYIYRSPNGEPWLRRRI